MITTRAMAPATLNYCVVSPRQTLTPRGTPFRPLTECNSKLKKPAFVIPEARERMGWSENFVESGPQKTPPSQIELGL
ncbi:hypothetical protein TNCV_67371 [Trichonephila clavipes]|nr:hypothetical protein TNCV_67371 [Trichonephila clavipes]